MQCGTRCVIAGLGTAVSPAKTRFLWLHTRDTTFFGELRDLLPSQWIIIFFFQVQLQMICYTRAGHTFTKRTHLKQQLMTTISCHSRLGLLFWTENTITYFSNKNLYRYILFEHTLFQINTIVKWNKQEISGTYFNIFISIFLKFICIKITSQLSKLKCWYKGIPYKKLIWVKKQVWITSKQICLKNLCQNIALTRIAY